MSLQKLCKNFPIYLFSVIPPCGATVTQNLTYLIQDVTTNPGLISCPYTICPITKAVNRIRLDLNVSIYSNAINTEGNFCLQDLNKIFSLSLYV